MYSTGTWQAHTPIITATALGEKLRVNIPITIGVGSGDINKDDLAVSTDIRIEYYFDSDIFSRLRVNLQYGMYRMKANENRSVRSNFTNKYGGNNEARNGRRRLLWICKRHYRSFYRHRCKRIFYRRNRPYTYRASNKIIISRFCQRFKGTSYSVTTPNGKLLITERLKFGHYIIDATSPMGAFDMDTSTTTGWYDMTTHRIKSEVEGASIDIGGQTYYITKPQFIGVSVPVGFTAESDLISIYLEPARFSFYGNRGGLTNTLRAQNLLEYLQYFIRLDIYFYGELSITPLPNLEWYFEAQIGSATTIDSLGNSSQGSLAFNGSTGLTWKF